MELAVMAGDEGPALLANFKGTLDVSKKADELIDSYKKEPAKALADTMRGLAQLNPCMRAKRCQLVPMKETGAKQAAKSGQGCCPGQTGHHLLPAEMFEDCPDYGTSSGSVHRNAPVVCTEGTNNTHGSHGAIHEKMEDLMQKHRKKSGDAITNDQAIDAAVESHTETFKPPCDPRCLKAQLKDYYDKLCNGKLKPRGGKGADTEGEAQETQAPSKGKSK
jgi:hypothetical protein